MSKDGLADWAGRACAELGVDAGQVDVDEILALARDVRREEGRPAALLAAYLLGVAVGRGADPKQAAARVAGLTRQRSDATCDWRD